MGPFPWHVPFWWLLDLLGLFDLGLLCTWVLSPWCLLYRFYANGNWICVQPKFHCRNHHSNITSQLRKFGNPKLPAQQLSTIGFLSSFISRRTQKPCLYLQSLIFYSSLLSTYAMFGWVYITWKLLVLGGYWIHITISSNAQIKGDHGSVWSGLTLTHHPNWSDWVRKCSAIFGGSSGLDLPIRNHWLLGQFRFTGAGQKISHHLILSFQSHMWT